ncbi:hypothetical protein FSP39_003761 [Pinctada imbricata]|uniref:XPA C-terminal domain-containing protein n=1 Tax=Pinctada imbricata TaxID=66713 RepID=A0AA88XEK0_PINIB|nr:hypothetical protein FSP39_003761 [Pinctada imbricata]
MASNEENAEDRKLTAAQRAAIERNRQKALLVREAKQKRKLFEAEKIETRVKLTKTVDTGAGFFLEEEDDKETKGQLKVVHPLGPLEPVTSSGDVVDDTICDNCGKEFMDSYLFSHFDALICDNCKEEDNPLITRTDAKNKYLLKDADFDKRDPKLKFIVRRNPHNPRWGDMKLYYEPQIYDRAMEVWGSEEGLEEAKDKRTENREKSKQKKFDKKVKELRLAVRSSLVKKDRGPHQHEFGEEQSEEEEDMYSKTCKTCGHVMTYEKM